MAFKEKTGEIRLLLVHREEILEAIRELEFSGRNPEYLSRLRQVNQEIGIIAGLPNSRRVEHYEPARIAGDVGNARQVIVYGCNRRACLDWVSSAVVKTGDFVSLSIKGTI